MIANQGRTHDEAYEILVAYQTAGLVLRKTGWNGPDESAAAAAMARLRARGQAFFHGIQVQARAQVDSVIAHVRDSDPMLARASDEAVAALLLERWDAACKEAAR